MVGIETVEVLKGPRSALLGRGEPGGTVNLVTKRPQFETRGDLRATLGRWDQTRFEGDFQTVAGSNDQLGLRIVGFYEDAESFRDTVETEKVGFYPSATLMSWNTLRRKCPSTAVLCTRRDLGFRRVILFLESPAMDRSIRKS